MQNKLLRFAFAGLLAVAVPSAAAAQTFVTPYAGIVKGGDANGTPFSVGASLMWVKAVGLEIDFSYTPDFFGEEDEFVLVADSNVTSLMANLVVAPGSAPVRPYASAGAGLLRARLDGGAGALFDDVSTNSFGMNAGAGLFAMFGDHAGIRADIRYFRALEDPEVDDDFDLSLGNLSFWRATVGVTFKF